MVARGHTLVRILVLLPVLSDAFILSGPERGATRIGYSKNDDPDNNDDATMLDELAWRAAKIRLEDAHTRSFLKRKPMKLRYRDARRWVQANLGAETKDEFKDMVANGNLRTPYIPKNPSTYYRETGDWISWDHFLKGYCGEEETGIQPRTGKFD
ncbi:hypothetical protein MHU86_10460 [Fragilaria crotonensis]|nr:hypothetical protein MHU86_10460 [Fragilaria crotonensis]